MMLHHGGFDYSFVVDRDVIQTMLEWLRENNITFWLDHKVIPVLGFMPIISLDREEDAIMVRLAWTEYLL